MLLRPKVHRKATKDTKGIAAPRAFGAYGPQRCVDEANLFFVSFVALW